ncbi:MAG: prepilin peptidase [Deltaproteobacteria bacterium]|nr:prepilin peptidase [Deltaproteobacteria bacterium]MDQ3301455.1 prepilin peptidase [Myxococcota bacterium]
MLEQLEPLTTEPVAYGFAIVLGLVWGSFANVCIYRWPPSEQFPKGRSVVKPGSHCFACQTPIRWYDNLPMISWLWLRGRCRSCKATFSGRYLIVEATTAALFGVAWWATVVANQMFEPLDVRLIRFAIYAAFCFVLVAITFIDIDHKLILNKVTIPSIVAFYLLGLALPGHAWWNGLVGIAVGYGVPWLIGEIYFRLKGREGLGLGDSMLLALIGALLGWRGVVFALFGGSVIGSVIGITALVLMRDRAEPAEPVAPAEKPAGPGQPDGDGEPAPDDEPSLMRTELPFGPFLAMAAVFYLFAEPWIQLNFKLLGG